MSGATRTYRYELVHNESEERADEGSGNFQWPYKLDGAFTATGFEDVADKLLQNFKSQFNQREDWSCNEEETRGEVWFSNSVDGMTLRFEVEEIDG